jgi:hypothetical protein
MPRIGLRDCAIGRARVDRVVFPPDQVAAVKAVACELPIRYGLPLSRFSRTEPRRLVIELAVADASASTVWRWLHDDALKLWQQRSWIYRRDPEFAAKAGRVLDLYERIFEGKRLWPDEYVISADRGVSRRIDRRDLLRGKNDAGDPRAVCPSTPRDAAQQTVFATSPRSPPSYPTAPRSRCPPTPRPRTTQSALAAPPATDASQPERCARALSSPVPSQRSDVGLDAPSLPNFAPRSPTPSIIPTRTFGQLY